MSKQAKQADGSIHEDQLLNFLVNSLDEEVDLDLGKNAEIDAEDIYEVLVGACADGTSVSELCENSNDSPHQNTVLYHLREKAQVFSEMFGHATALLSGSKNYLMRQVIELYRAYGLFDRVEPPYPSLHELQQFIQADKINHVRKTANYRDRVLNRLEAMTLTAGTVFDCSEGYSLEELLEPNVVFEFDGLGTDLQNFLMESLFAAVYEFRVAQTQRGGSLRHVFFLDEGKQLFSVYKERQDAAGIPAIDMLTAKMREFGEGLVVADQEATKLTDSIKANTGTTVLLATGDATQFEDIAAAMNLSDRQASIAQRLGTGEAIVQTGKREPCPVRLDTYELEKTVSDTALRKTQQAKWNALSWTRRDRPDAFLQEATPTNADSTEPVIPDEPQPDIALSDTEDHLLTDIVERPFVFLTERYLPGRNGENGVRATTGRPGPVGRTRRS